MCAMEHVKPGMVCEVSVHWNETDKIAYTIRGVVSSLQTSLGVTIAIREFRYPDGSVKKASGLTCYDASRVIVPGT